MIYSLKPNWWRTATGVDGAIKNRMLLFRNNDIPHKVVTAMFNTHRYAERIYDMRPNELENMYDFFQNANKIDEKVITVQDIFPSDVFKVERVTKSLNFHALRDYKIYRNEVYIAYVGCYEGQDMVYYISYYDKSRKRVKRCYYDYRGFLSLERFFTDSHTCYLEIFYTADGNKAIEKYYARTDNHVSLTTIMGKVHRDDIGEYLCLYSEDELIRSYLGKLLKENDVVIIDKSSLYMKAVLQQNKKLKTIAVIHSTHYRGSNHGKGRIKDTYSEIFTNLDKIDAIVVSTEKQRNDIIERFNIKGKIHCIPVGIRKDEIQISMHNSLKIISVARLAPEKRIEHTILAFVEIYKHFPEARLHLFGVGPEEAMLRRLVCEHELNDVVMFRGFLPDLSLEYATSKLILLTSEVEGFCLVLLEAASHGIPAISYDIRYGPSEIIDDGESGYLTDENPAMIAEKAISLLSNPDQYKIFSDNAYAKSFSFCAELVYDKWEKLLVPHQAENSREVPIHKKTASNCKSWIASSLLFAMTNRRLLEVASKG